MASPTDRNRFRDCRLNDNYTACTVVAVRRSDKKVKINDGLNGEESRTYEYHIVVGGPNPHLCDLDAIKALAYAFVPSLPGDVELPAPSSFIYDTADPNKYFAVQSVRLKHNKSNFRFVVAEVTADNKCIKNNPYYKPDGTLITSINDLHLAAAKITRRRSSRQVKTEFADFINFYNRWGDKDDGTLCSTPLGDEECCRPADYFGGADYDKLITPMNTAGVPFDPPLTRDEGEVSYIISKPFFAVNGCKLDRLEYKINCQGFWLVEFVRGRMTFCAWVEPGTARIDGVNMTPTEFCDGTPIVLVSVEMRIRNNKVYGQREWDSEAGEFFRPVRNFGWDELVPNKGFGALLCPGDTDQFGGEFGSDNGNDQNVHGYAATQLITDSQGNPVEDAAWLDCAGRPLTLKQVQSGGSEGCRFGVDPDQLLYLRWRNYTAISFLSPDVLPDFINHGIYAEDDKPDQPEGYPSDPCECGAEELDEIYVCTTTTPS